VHCSGSPSRPMALLGRPRYSVGALEAPPEANYGRSAHTQHFGVAGSPSAATTWEWTLACGDLPAPTPNRADPYFRILGRHCQPAGCESLRVGGVTHYARCSAGARPCTTPKHTALSSSEGLLRFALTRTKVCVLRPCWFAACSCTGGARYLT